MVATNDSGGEEEDLGALIYRESQLRKAEAAEELTEKKVTQKQYKKKCSADGCSNIVVKGGVCIRHGAKVKRCSSEGCTNQAQKGGVCMRHGAKVKLCSSEGCTNITKKGGVCMRHGAKVKRCISEGCTNIAKKGGVCWRHRAYRNTND